MKMTDANAFKQNENIEKTYSSATATSSVSNETFDLQKKEFLGKGRGCGAKDAANRDADVLDASESPHQGHVLQGREATPEEVAEARKNGTIGYGLKDGPAGMSKHEGQAFAAKGREATPEEVAEARKNGTIGYGLKDGPAGMSKHEGQAFAAKGREATPEEVAEARKNGTLAYGRRDQSSEANDQDFSVKGQKDVQSDYSAPQSRAMNHFSSPNDAVNTWKRSAPVDQNTTTQP
jgi:predicted transcriptional regulator